MEINALDQLFRSEQSGPSTARRQSDSADKRFSNLLDAQSARARVDRPAQRAAEAVRRQEDPAVKTVRAERTEGEEHVERKDASERPERKGRFERAHKKETAAEKPEASEKPGVTEKVDGTEGGILAQAVKKAAVGDAAVPAAVNDAKVDENSNAGAADAGAADGGAAVVALPAAADPVAALLVVKLDTPDPVAVPVAPVVQIQAEPDAAADVVEADANAAEYSVPVPGMAKPVDGEVKPAGAKAGAEAKLAAAAQIALPTSTLAETAKHAEPATEDYADFMLRNAAATTALPAAEVGKEAVKAEADAKEGRLIVTIAQPAAIAAPVAPVTAFAVQAVVSNDNASLDTTLAARAPVELDDVKAPTKPAEPTNLFAQNLDSARAAQATEEPKPAARTPLVPPHEQVAVHIRKAVADGLDQISIRLNPLELGRIDIKLDIAADGSLRAAFAADRQQTLELLKNDSRQLENALSEAGLRADSGGLNFSLRGDNRENAQAFRDMGAQFANRRNAGEEAEGAATAVAAGYVRPRAGNGRIDLNA